MTPQRHKVRTDHRACTVRKSHNLPAARHEKRRTAKHAFPDISTWKGRPQSPPGHTGPSQSTAGVLGVVVAGVVGVVVVPPPPPPPAAPTRIRPPKAAAPRAAPGTTAPATTRPGTAAPAATPPAAAPAPAAAPVPPAPAPPAAPALGAAWVDRVVISGTSPANAGAATAPASATLAVRAVRIFIISTPRELNLSRRIEGAR